VLSDQLVLSRSGKDSSLLLLKATRKSFISWWKKIKKKKERKRKEKRKKECKKERKKE